MHSLQRSGGVAALGAAITFVIGFALYFALLIPAGYGSLKIDAVKHAGFLVQNQTVMYVWNLIIYVIFGVLLVTLTLALNERLKTQAPVLMRLATAFGLIWATLVIASGMIANVGAGVVVELYGRQPEAAATVWLSLMVMINGLGGGNEIVGGLWLMLVSLSVLRVPALPRALGYLGIVVGMAGLVTTIPMLREAGSAFGLGLIVWFVWVGIKLLQTPGDAAPLPA